MPKIHVANEGKPRWPLRLSQMWEKPAVRFLLSYGYPSFAVFDFGYIACFFIFNFLFASTVVLPNVSHDFYLHWWYCTHSIMIISWSIGNCITYFFMRYIVFCNLGYFQITNFMFWLFLYFPVCFVFFILFFYDFLWILTLWVLIASQIKWLLIFVDQNKPKV